MTSDDQAKLDQLREAIKNLGGAEQIANAEPDIQHVADDSVAEPQLYAAPPTNVKKMSGGRYVAFFKLPDGGVVEVTDAGPRVQIVVRDMYRQQLLQCTVQKPRPR